MRNWNIPGFEAIDGFLYFLSQDVLNRDRKPGERDRVLHTPFQSSRQGAVLCHIQKRRVAITTAAPIANPESDLLQSLCVYPTGVGFKIRWELEKVSPEFVDASIELA